MSDSHDSSIYLIGYRGAGKTTVARLLAERLGWDWVDADDEVERRAGKTIAEMFATEGEAAFRQLESEVVQELCRWRKSVVALGGGAVQSEANRNAIRLAGRVVWLKTTVETLAQRLAADDTTANRRPNLTQSGGLSEIETLLATREPIYRACATLEVDTEDKSPAEVAEEVARKLERRESGAGGT